MDAQGWNTSSSALPPRVLAWYGDDFTGSTDVLEGIAPDIRSVLFLKRPDESFFEQFSDYAAFGLAGMSRSETPEWMDTHLEDAFSWLRTLDAPICHYKVCSTFDSSPEVGNIGRATEIGKRLFASTFVPMVVGAPSMRRYTIFGNLFAGVDGVVYRIDRHPTMKCHPVTPMSEADLRLHLGKQTELKVGLVDMLQVESENVCQQYRAIHAKSDAVLIDVMNDATLRTAGRLLWTVDRQPFVVGSSGVEHGLIAFWRDQGYISETPKRFVADPTDRILVLSGSCSPVTQRQIQYAGQNGFALVRIDVHGITSGERAESAANEACRSAVEALNQNRSAILYTAASPQDRVETFDSAASQLRFRQTLSEKAGQVLNRVIDQTGVKRIVVAGGDTSSHGGQQLGIEALTFLAHLAPGAPLCRTWSQKPNRQDLEIVFKGGQCGQEDFFELVLSGSLNGRT